MTDDRPASELYDGCPNCKRPLHSEGNYVVCGNCGFKIATSMSDVKPSHALAAVEALVPEFERWERTNRLNSQPGSDPDMHAEDYMLGRADVLVEVIKHLRAVLAGDTSALDAVKAVERERVLEAAKAEAPSLLAAERERIAQAQEAFASDLRNAPDEDLTVPGWVVGVRLAARIAREGGAKT